MERSLRDAKRILVQPWAKETNLVRIRIKNKFLSYICLVGLPFFNSEVKVKSKSLFWMYYKLSYNNMYSFCSVASSILKHLYFLYIIPNLRNTSGASANKFLAPISSLFQTSCAWNKSFLLRIDTVMGVFLYGAQHIISKCLSYNFDII